MKTIIGYSLIAFPFVAGGIICILTGERDFGITLLTIIAFLGFVMAGAYFLAEDETNNKSR